MCWKLTSSLLPQKKERFEAKGKWIIFQALEFSTINSMWVFFWNLYAVKTACLNWNNHGNSSVQYVPEKLGGDIMSYTVPVFTEWWWQALAIGHSKFCIDNIGAEIRNATVPKCSANPKRTTPKKQQKTTKTERHHRLRSMAWSPSPANLWGKAIDFFKNQQADVSSHRHSETNKEFTKNSNAFSNMIHFLFGAMFDLFA